MSVIETKAPADGRAHARLDGRWLALTRAVWIGVTAASLGLFASSVPAGYSLLRTVCADGPVAPSNCAPRP